MISKPSPSLSIIELSLQLIFPVPNDMVVGARLDDPLPNGGFKTCSDARWLLCKHIINTDSFWSPITGRTYKILDNRSCRKDNFCKFALSNLLGKQVISAKESTTTARPQRPRKSTSPFRNFSMWGVTNGKTLITVVLLTIILIGRTQRGKAREISRFTDLNYSDLIAWTSNLTSLKWTSHSLISPDTYVVILSNLSTASLSVISIL